MPKLLPAEDRISVPRSRASQIAKRAIDQVAAGQYRPRFDEVLPVIVAGLRPGDTVTDGRETYTYLGTAEILYQRRSSDHLMGRHILLRQETRTADDTLVDLMLWLKAANYIQARWERMAPRGPAAMGGRRR